MSDTELQRSIRDHYEGRRLPSDRMDALMQAADAVEGSAPPARRRLWIAGAVAAAVLAVGFWVVFRGPDQASVDAMAKKIALGHTKDLAAEFRASAIEGLHPHMPKLDFAVAAPRDERVAGLTLVGARYCSLNQQIAALLKFEDAGGRRHTMYQVADDEVFDSAAGRTVTRDGLRIRFWRERGVFVGLASPAD